jgi:hypothetical protein
LWNVVGFSCRGCFFVLLVLPGMKQRVAGLEELLCFGLVGRMPVPMDRTPTKTTCTTTCKTTSRTEQQNSKEKVEVSLVLCIARQPYRFTPSYVQFNAIRFRFHLTMVHVNAVLVVFFPFFFLLFLFLVLLRLPW